MAQKIRKKAREWTDEWGINTEIKINSVWMHWNFKFLKEKLKREETAATFPSVLLQNLVYLIFKAAILDFMMPQKSCFFSSKLVVDIKLASSIVLEIYQNPKNQTRARPKTWTDSDKNHRISYHLESFSVVLIDLMPDTPDFSKDFGKICLTTGRKHSRCSGVQNMKTEVFPDLFTWQQWVIKAI